MFQLFANIFGYLLQFLYEIVNNYGLAIIIFTVVIKIMLLPLSIKQQRSMKKNVELQEKIKVIQFKYKNDQETMQKELMNLYKTENVSPFAGCLTAILQLIILLSIFYMVRAPLTFMQKIPIDNINTYKEQLKEEGKVVNEVYPEIDLIKEYEFLKEKNPEDENVEKIDIHMNLFGLDLSKIPQQNMTDYKVYIIPVLYIISSFISMRLTTAMQEKQKTEKEKDSLVVDYDEYKELVSKESKENELDEMMETNKMMSWMTPILSISIAFVAPLGLALYWLMNNILMIIERIILDKVIESQGRCQL